MPIYRTIEPVDHVLELKDKVSDTEESYGIDSPMGMLSSMFLAPLYLYATLKGKYDAWDSILDSIPSCHFRGPTLDAGCGRGLVLIKTALRSGGGKMNYGIDIFDPRDQSGNSPLATVTNILARDVMDKTVLNTASFLNLPFRDGVFSLVTSSLALHNPPSVSDREKAVRELARVTAIGGMIVILDLAGRTTTRLYVKVLNELGGFEVESKWAGTRVMFGGWWCDLITAKKV